MTHYPTTVLKGTTVTVLVIMTAFPCKRVWPDLVNCKNHNKIII